MPPITRDLVKIRELAYKTLSQHFNDMYFYTDVKSLPSNICIWFSSIIVLVVFDLIKVRMFQVEFLSMRKQELWQFRVEVGKYWSIVFGLYFGSK